MTDQPRDLVLLDQAKRAITAATRIDEIKDIANKAEAIRLYYKKAKDGLEIQNRAAEIKLRAERRAGELIRELDLARGKRTDLVPRRDQVNGKKTLAELGINKNESSRWQQVASLSQRVFEKHISDSKRCGRELTSAGTIKLAKRLANHKAASVAGQASGAGPGFTSRLDELIDSGVRFASLYADPPWQYDNCGSRGAAENHYATMSVQQICRLPVNRLVARNAHLHLWTTNAFLFEAKQVIEAWGFEYKSCFVWVKPQVGMGNYWRLSHEFLLLGVRGNCPFRDNAARSWVELCRQRHSEKPEEIRSLVERVSPGPYLELFGRKRVTGWTVFGNQCLPR